MLVKVIQSISRFLAIISALATLILMLLTVVDVFSRMGGGGSIPGLLELSEVALVFVVFCGIAFGQQHRTHVAVSLLTARLPENLGRVLVSIGLVVIMVIFVWATYATGVQAIESTMRQESRFGITAVPIWPSRILIPVGFGLLLLETLIQLIQVVKGEEKIRDESPISEEELLS